MEDKKGLRTKFLELVFVIVIIVLDQFVKNLVDIYLVPFGSSVSLWKGIFHLTSVHNTGAAFSMLSNNYWFLITVRIIVSSVIIFLLIKNHKQWHFMFRISLIIILAGALGNLIDQIALGYVRDMFEFRFINFAVFNVADIYICSGVTLLVIDMLFLKGKTPQNDNTH